MPVIIRPLNIQLKFSAYLLGYFFILHGLAMLAIIILTLASWVKWCLVVGVVISFAYYVQTYVLASFRNRVDQLMLNEKAQWFIQDQAGIQTEVRLQQFFHLSGLILLNFSSDNFFSTSVMLFSDSADKDDLRQLRIYLKFAKNH